MGLIALPVVAGVRRARWATTGAVLVLRARESRGLLVPAPVLLFLRAQASGALSTLALVGQTG